MCLGKVRTDCAGPGDVSRVHGAGPVSRALCELELEGWRGPEARTAGRDPGGRWSWKGGESQAFRNHLELFMTPQQVPLQNFLWHTNPWSLSGLWRGWWGSLGPALQTDDGQGEISALNKFRGAWLCKGKAQALEAIWGPLFPLSHTSLTSI